MHIETIASRENAIKRMKSNNNARETKNKASQREEKLWYMLLHWPHNFGRKIHDSQDK